MRSQSKRNTNQQSDHIYHSFWQVHNDAIANFTSHRKLCNYAELTQMGKNTFGPLVEMF
jgi:hypothetical protein